VWVVYWLAGLFERFHPKTAKEAKAAERQKQEEVI
jgi:hypothetical protein